MKTFKDNNGRQWQLELTFDSAKRVRDLLDVNLLAPEQGQPPLLTKLGTDEILLCDVIYVLVKPQADEAGISDVQFGQALGGDAICNAVNAFYDELMDFFRKRGRLDRAQAVATQKQMIDLAVSRTTETLQNLDLAREVESIFGRLSINGPESSASIRDP